MSWSVDQLVPWYLEVADGWKVQRAKSVLRKEKVLNKDRLEAQILSLTLRGVVENDPENPEGLVPADYGTYQIFEKDDLVFKLIDLDNVRTSRVGHVHRRGIMSSAYMRLRPSASVDTRFIYWQFFDLYNRQVFNQLGSGVRSTLNADDVLNLPMLVPPLSHQKAIANFLDRETTRIDAVIEKKRRLVDLITMRTFQFASSVCSNADDSDEENWQRMPLKSLFSFSKGKDAQRLNGEYVANHEGSYAVYSGQTSGDAVFGLIDSFDFDLPGGAILVATVGAEAMSCRIVAGRFSLSQNCALMIPRPGTKVVLSFILGQLRDLFIEKRAEIPDHMQPSLRIEDLNRFFIKVPSLEMQESIALLINEKWTSTSTLLKALESQVEKLIERRSSLITDAVAGKVEIPGVAA